MGSHQVWKNFKTRWSGWERTWPSLVSETSEWILSPTPDDAEKNSKFMPIQPWPFRNIRPIHVFVLPGFITRDIAIGFSFSWLGLRVGGHCLEWLAVGLSRFLIYLALSPHLIIWSCEAVCPYGSRVCHGLPNRLWVAWVSRFKCRYLDTQLWELYCFLNNWHDTLSEAVGGNQILGVHLHNFANNSHGIQIFMKYRLFHCMAIWNGVFPCVAYGRWLENEPS